MTWQQLAKIGRSYKVLRQASEPILYSPNSGLSQSDSDIPLEDLSVTTKQTDVDWDAHSDASGESQETELLQPEGDTPSTPVTAGTSQRGQVRTMLRRMADSVSQRDFYGTRNMHYMALKSTIGETDDDLFHDAHLELQECMRNPLRFMLRWWVTSCISIKL